MASRLSENDRQLQCETTNVASTYRKKIANTGHGHTQDRLTLGVQCFAIQTSDGENLRRWDNRPSNRFGQALVAEHRAIVALPMFDVSPLFVAADLVNHFLLQFAAEHAVFTEEVVTSLLPVFLVQCGSGSVGQHWTGIQLDDTRVRRTESDEYGTSELISVT